MKKCPGMYASEIIPSLKVQAFTWHSKNKNIFDHNSSKVTSVEFTTSTDGAIIKTSNNFFLFE